MNLKDITRNQHFISQAEQRLNAINQLDKEKNQKILSFSLVDRESHSISLDSQNGFKISNTLSLNDIFSFDVLKKETARYNFEKLFHQYESNIRINTESLISKLHVTAADIKSEIFNLYLSKFLNFIRNPYSIKKVLNTFPQFRNLYPTDPIHHKNFEHVLNGRKPQQRYLCNQLGVTENDYLEWLSVIFILLTPLKEGQSNLLEQSVKALFEDKNLFVTVHIHTFDDKTCLLSDRGYSIPLPEDNHMSFDFNLYSKGFIRYFFGNLDSLVPNAPKNLIEMFKDSPRHIDVHPIKNDLNTLAKYNKNVVYQCYQNVFNSSFECYGL